MQDETKSIALALIERVNRRPFPEKNEELRMKIMKLLNLIITKMPDSLISSLEELTKGISCTLLDDNPDMKIMLVPFIEITCQKYENKIGHFMASVVDSLFTNLVNKRYRIRMLSLNALSIVIKLDGATPFLSKHIKLLTLVSNDEHEEVRNELYKTINKWLESFDINDLKKFESSFIQLLLNGISDEREAISEQCTQILDIYGTKLQKLLVELKDENANLNVGTFEKKANFRLLN